MFVKHSIRKTMYFCIYMFSSSNAGHEFQPSYRSLHPVWAEIPRLSLWELLQYRLFLTATPIFTCIIIHFLAFIGFYYIFILFQIAYYLHISS